LSHFRLAVLVLLVACVLPSRVRAAAPPPVPLAWVQPSEVRVVTLRAGELARVERAAAADGAIALRAGELLLFPVKAGDAVRVEGGRSDVGLGTGSGAYADAVTFLPDPSPGSTRELRIPVHSMARFCVVRGQGGAAVTLRVYVARPLERPMRWFRADEDVAAYLDGGARPNFAGELDALEPELRVLDAAREALGSAARTDAGRAWLQAAWLEATLRRRPMDAPFAAPGAVAVAGGRVLRPQEVEGFRLEPGLEHRALRSGERVTLRAAEGTVVVTVTLRLRAVGRSELVVREGDVLHSVVDLSIPRRAEDQQRWAPPRAIRLISSSGLPLSVELVRGDALLSFRPYRVRTSALDLRDLRDPSALLERARSARGSGANAVVAALADFARLKTREAAARLEASLGPRVPEAVRALAWHALAVHAVGSRVEGLRPLEQLWAATASLPPAIALPLRRSALERSAERQARLPPGRLSRLASSTSLSPALTEDEIATEALAGLVSPVVDRLRPGPSARAEALALSRGLRSDLTSVAHRSWFRAAPWVWIDPTDDTGVVEKLRPIFDTLPDELCSVDTPQGLRWVLLDHTPLALDVKEGPGSHARVVLRGETERPVAESRVMFGSAEVAVHGGAGLTSLVALAPGPLQARVTEGAPVLARVPLEQSLPCPRLRELERWVRVDGSARFRIPAPGAPTVATVILDPSSLEGSESRVTVIVGDARFEAIVLRGGTGAVEVPIPAAAEELEVRVDRRVLLRTRVRMHPRGGAPRGVRVPVAERPSNFESELAAVRNATRYLRLADSDVGRKKLRLERARALEAVGYARLAALDRARAGEREPEADVAASADYLELAGGSPPLVILGITGKIPPLPLPSERAGLAAARRALGRGEPSLRVLTMLGPSAEKSVAADALLFASLAESLGLTRAAADAYERIGDAHRAGDALGRAAVLFADLAADEQRPELGLKAYVLGKRAAALGASVAGTFGRLDQAVAWQAVTADSAGGSALIQQARIERGELSTSEAVRAALLDASPLTRLFSGPDLEIGVSQLNARALQVEHVCHALEGEREDCAYRFSLDGKSTSCEPLAGTPENASANGVARPARCRLELPVGARRVTVSAPEGAQSVGFVDVRRVVDGETLPLLVATRFYESTPVRPVRVTLLGPTVLRVTARSYAGEHAKLSVTQKSLRDPALEQRESVDLPDKNDRFARRAEDDAQVTEATELYFPIVFDGPTEVTLSGGPRVLVRLERAKAVSLPRPRAAASTASAASDSGAKTRALPVAVEPRLAVGWDRTPGPLTLRAYASGVSADLAETDTDPRSLHAEVGVAVARELVEQRSWGRFGLFGRARSGPASTGADAEIMLAAAGLVPGAYARGRYLLQPLPQGTLFGGYLSAGVFSSFELRPDFALSPLLGLVVRDADERGRSEPAVDREIYTSYASRHPWSADAALYASQRIAIDAALRYGLAARFLPEFRGLDRGDASVRGRLTAGRGLTPHVELETKASLRPEGPFRDESFVRFSVSPSVLFWEWVGSGRLTAAAGVSYSADVPADAGRGGELSAELTLAGELGFRRGLADTPAADRPFRPRLEEGANLPERAKPARDAYWSDE
jgi:hypothetical protein